MVTLNIICLATCILIFVLCLFATRILVVRKAMETAFTQHHVPNPTSFGQ
jgi:hypothetical protein